MLAPKNTFDIISITHTAGKLSAVYAVIKYFHGHLVQYLYLYLLTYLLTYLSVNFGCVKNLATHHTDFTPLFHFSAYMIS